MSDTNSFGIPIFVLKLVLHTWWYMTSAAGKSWTCRTRACTTSAQSPPLVSSQVYQVMFSECQAYLPYTLPWIFSFFPPHLFHSRKKTQSVLKLNCRFCKLFLERNNHGVWSSSSLCDRLAFLTLLGREKISSTAFMYGIAQNKNNCLSSLFACHIQAINNLCVRTTPLSRASCLQIVQHTISISFRLQRTSTHPNQDLYSISGSIVCTWIFQLFQKIVLHVSLFISEKGNTKMVLNWGKTI